MSSPKIHHTSRPYFIHRQTQTRQTIYNVTRKLDPNFLPRDCIHDVGPVVSQVVVAILTRNSSAAALSNEGRLKLSEAGESFLKKRGYKSIQDPSELFRLIREVSDS